MDFMTGLDLVVGVGVVAAALAGVRKWWPRKAEEAVPVPKPEPVPVTLEDLLEVAKPPVTTRTRKVRVSAAIGVEPIDGVGWLSPDGEFHGNGGGTHYKSAYRILDPENHSAGREPEPTRNFELEIEQLGYVKLIRNSYFYGWTRPAKWRLTRPQREEILNWYLMHERQMPDWLKEMSAV